MLGAYQQSGSGIGVGQAHHIAGLLGSQIEMSVRQQHGDGLLLGVVVSAAIRQPRGNCVSAIDVAAEAGMRSKVPLGRSWTEAAPKTGSSFSADQIDRTPLVEDEYRCCHDCGTKLLPW